MKLDAANGVGARQVRGLLEHIGDIMSILVYNDGTNGKLNYMVSECTCDIHFKLYICSFYFYSVELIM